MPMRLTSARAWRMAPLTLGKRSSSECWDIFFADCAERSLTSKMQPSGRGGPGPRPGATLRVADQRKR